MGLLSSPPPKSGSATFTTLGRSGGRGASTLRWGLPGPRPRPESAGGGLDETRRTCASPQGAGGPLAPGPAPGRAWGGGDGTPGPRPSPELRQTTYQGAQEQAEAQGNLGISTDEFWWPPPNPLAKPSKRLSAPPPRQRYGGKNQGKRVGRQIGRVGRPRMSSRWAPPGGPKRHRPLKNWRRRQRPLPPLGQRPPRPQLTKAAGGWKV